ncbi:acyl-CoA N-acyltransferase [Paraphysoderma sedebokerense]|nr:acyl-CoA N-acyltransferase [Paraphysoderma sedebokerense]
MTVPTAHPNSTVTTKIVSTLEERQKAYDVRFKVFVDEQKVNPDNEIDEIDDSATHVLLIQHSSSALTGKSEDKVIGTVRVYIKGDGAERKEENNNWQRNGKLGRLAVLKEERGKGYGKILVQEGHNVLRKQGIQLVMIHAQCVARKFYESCGYKCHDETIFYEEGIPHIAMTAEI